MSKFEGRTALVLSGAVAKGPFHAGVISALVERGESIDAVVGTSAGALTATLFCAGLVTDRISFAADEIERLWLDKAAWREFALLSGRSLLQIQGLFRSDKVQALLRGGIERVLDRSPPQHNIPLTLVATNLNGLTDPNEPLHRRRTTYEWALRFHADDYAPDRLDRLTAAATASATFPGLFSPGFVDGQPCVDGGAVNNAPISYAIEDTAIDRVIVVSPQPPSPPPPPVLGGIDLLGHLVDILINERLHRDLQLAHRINRHIALLERELSDLPAERRKKIFDTLNWRKLDVIEIRPTEALAGNSLTGFWDRTVRAGYLKAGHQRACAVLEGYPPRSHR